MKEPLAIPHLTYEQLRSAAEQFLSRHHPTRKIPIPIEEIVEFRLHLDIVPIPGLLEAYGIDGFTSGDLREISVDLFVYEHRPRRYRFTLAHEVAHVALHAQLFQEHTFRTVDEWKQFVKGFPDMDISRLEWQAHCFAGLVLVPKESLEKVAREKIRLVKVPKMEAEKDFAKALVIEKIAEHFEVSSEVVERRLSFDGIDLAAFWP